MNRISKIVIRMAIMPLFLLGFVYCGPKADLLENQVFPDKGTSEEGDASNSFEDVSTENLEGQLQSGLVYVIDYREHKYQYQRSNSVDAFSGYMSVSNSDFQYGGRLPYIYYYPNTYYQGPLGESMKLFPYLYHAYTYAANENHNLPEWKAIAQILYGYSMQELVDFYGTMPYDDYRNKKETPPLNYYSGRKCYELILADLAEAVETLKTARPDATKLQRIEGTKGGYSDGNWEKWVKFANSIRLRMALNMVNADPTWAQTVAEEVMADPIGVLLETDGDFQLPDDGQTQHCLYQISAVWNDIRLGATLENILKRYEHPLLEKWFSKNSAAIKAREGGALMLQSGKDYVGIRNGVQMYGNSGNTVGYGTFSAFADRYMPRAYFKVAENLFNLSEAALRGWNVKGTAQHYYERGVRCAFDAYGLGGQADAYLQKTKVKNVDYTDYYVPSNSCKGRVTVGVKWDESDENEVKLEKIITQKYIANFPMGAEAWTTFRRTGYPRVFPVPEDKGWTYDNSFDVETQIRRIPFNMETSNDLANLSNIETALGAPNAAGTQVWWDTTDWTQRDENGWPIPDNF